MVGIACHEDIGKAFAALGDLPDQDQRVLRDPAPRVMVSELADSAVTTNLRCWANSADFWRLKFDLPRAVKDRLDAEGISIPFPQCDVHLYRDSTEAPA